MFLKDKKLRNKNDFNLIYCCSSQLQNGLNKPYSTTQDASVRAVSNPLFGPKLNVEMKNVSALTETFYENSSRNQNKNSNVQQMSVGIINIESYHTT